jgi:pimeloyl-ACP methyl ester carboxylesterase
MIFMNRISAENLHTFANYLAEKGEAANPYNQAVAETKDDCNLGLRPFAAKYEIPDMFGPAPPEGTPINLHVTGSSYAPTYTFHAAFVSDAAQVVAHLLVPQGKGRLIILFRGTTFCPATYKTTSGMRLEPTGFAPDTDPIGVGFLSYGHIAKNLEFWITEFGARRNITFIGHSLGGALALRALLACRDKNIGGHSRAYIFSSVGVDFYTAHCFKYIYPATKSQKSLVAVWHRDDIVAKTGHFPSMNGTEIYCGLDDSFPWLSPSDKHGLPFVALSESWSMAVCMTPREKPAHHVISNLARGVVRRAAAAGQIVDHVVHRLDAYVNGPGLLMGLVDSEGMARIRRYREQLDQSQQMEIVSKS